MVAGPVVGGLLVGAGLGGVGLAVDSATFAVSAILLIGLTDRHISKDGRPRLMTAVREGWTAITNRPWLVMLMSASALFELLALSAVFSLGPAVVEQSLGGAEVWGMLVTSFGCGGIIGGLLATRLSPARPVVWCAVLLAVLSAQPLFLATGQPAVVIAVLQFLAGMALSVYAAIASSTTQRMVPGHLQSRVASFGTLATTSLLPVGYAIIGAMTAIVGLIETMWAVGSLSITLCLAPLLSSGVRGVRRDSAPQEDS
jgi:hypothetical protein